MTSLPPALAAWAEPLSVFPPELALSLGPCVHRLSQAIGPLPRPAEGASLDPDGYDGLGRRGSYERLLVSEWLLAEEAPEEFLRRAAQREHVFLARSFRRPSGSRRSLALFDAGPELIGGPRIGQLAALVVLAARARRDGAAFGWGILQDEEREVWEEVTPASVLRLLSSRTARSARSDDAARWLEAAGEPAAADDLWVVGGTGSIRLGGAAASRLELEDSLQPGKRELLATIRRAGAQPRPLELPLPRREDCVRLVRDPFSARRAAPAASPRSRATGIAFSQEGRRLLVRYLDGSLSAHPVPSSPRAPPGRTRTLALKEGETLVAAGWARGARLVLAQTERGFYLYDVRRPASPPAHLLLETPAFTACTAPAPLSLLLRVQLPSPGAVPSRSCHVFLDGESQLFRVDGESHLITKLFSDVLAYTERAGVLHVVRGLRTTSGYTVAYCAGQVDLVLRNAAAPGLRAFFGSDSPLIAIELEPDRWEVFGVGPRARRYTLVAPTGSEVFGIATLHRESGEPGLLVIEPDRLSISLIGLREHRVFPRASSPIAFALANPRRPEVATLGVDGRVAVMSLPHREKLLELSPQSAGSRAPDPERS